MKSFGYGPRYWSERSSLSRGNSKRRTSKTCRVRARQAARAEIEEELAHYYDDTQSGNNEGVGDGI